MLFIYDSLAQPPWEFSGSQRPNHEPDVVLPIPRGSDLGFLLDMNVVSELWSDHAQEQERLVGLLDPLRAEVRTWRFLSGLTATQTVQVIALCGSTLKQPTTCRSMKRSAGAFSHSSAHTLSVR